NLKPLDDQELKLIFQQFNAEDVGIPGGNGVFPANATVRYPEERRKMFSAEYDINNISNSLRKISAKYFYQYMLRDVENIPHQVKTVAASNGQPAKRVNVLEIDPTAEHNSYGLQFQSDFTLGSNYYLIAGVDYWQRRYTGIRTNSQKIEVLGANGATVKTMYKTTYDKALPDATYGSTGFFVNNEIGLIEKKLKLLLGGRFDLINIKNDETKSPLYDITDGTVNYTPAGQTILWKAGTAKNTSYTYSAGLLYSLSEHSSLSFNAARSFRSPSLEERYQYIDQGSYIRIGDPQLKPEKGYFLDLGLRTNGNGLRTRASIFYNYLNDLVTEITGTYQGRNAFIKTNIGEASIYGFELETSYDVLSTLGVYNTISFVRGKDLKAKNDLPQIPPLNGNAGIRFYLIKEMTADISAVYFAAQNKVAPGEIKTPGYVYFNIDISSSMINLGPLNLRLICGAENILNKEYRNHLSTNRGSITTEPGRNIYIKTNIAW
ncbi:MAG: TonB-dependent receptor, partial [Bacteroidota bacterium]|nr:TonB-dependent receptor [Bacteroidota bacterium]